MGQPSCRAREYLPRQPWSLVKRDGSPATFYARSLQLLGDVGLTEQSNDIWSALCITCARLAMAMLA